MFVLLCENMGVLFSFVDVKGNEEKYELQIYCSS